MIKAQVMTVIDLTAWACVDVFQDFVASKKPS